MGLCHVYFPVAPRYPDVEFEEQYGVYVRPLYCSSGLRKAVEVAIY